MLWFRQERNVAGKRARLSIEILVVFIAVLLTCFVVVFIVINPSMVKESKDITQTSKNAAERAGNIALKVNQIYVEDGQDATPASIDYWYVQMKLAPGSQWIAMNTTLMILSIGNESSRQYTYDRTINCSKHDISAIDSLYNQSHTNTFGVEYALRTANPDAIPGYLMTGDIMVTCLRTPRTISNDEIFDFTIIPKNGVVFNLEQSMPENLNMQRTVVYERN
jgi:archaellin